MNVVNIFGLVRKVPTEWRELKKADALWLVARFAHLLKPSYDFRLRFLMQLLNIQWWRFFTLKKLMNLPVEQISYMTGLVNWVFPIDKITLTTNFYKTKWVPFAKLIGPADKLENLTLAEFSFADHYFRQYMATQDIIELDKLCAVLWRKKAAAVSVDTAEYKNDTRILFNSYAIKKNALRFKFTSKLFKFFVLMYFWGSRNVFVADYPNVFNGANDKKSASLDIGWVSVMFELAGSKFGTLEETSKQDLTTILLYLENSLINIKNQKKNDGN